MDVLDVWFESGCTHAWVVEGRYGAGTVSDLWSEGSDQHRGWFQSSLLESVATRGRAPYKALRTHGFVLAEDGLKMAKSEGNGVSPVDMADRYGADVLRLWVAASDTYADVRFSEATMRLQQETLRRFRNTLRWMLGNLSVSPRLPVTDAQREEPERWVLTRLNEVNRALRTDVEAHDFGAMVTRLSTFCADDLSAFWFNMRKDALYCDPAGSARRHGVVATLELVFDHLVSWLAPLVPFSAEEAWRSRHGADRSVHEMVWPDPDPSWDDLALSARWRTVRKLRDLVIAAIEPEQQAGRVRSLLDTHPVVDVPEVCLADLDGVDLAMVCGTSSLTVVPGNWKVRVDPAGGLKCVRCWRVLPEVMGSEGQLCQRCTQA
jgi:isoleucyl-tRNA synthetase